MFFLRAFLALTASFALVSGTHAAPITFNVDGTVNFVSSELTGSFAIGDAFHLEYTFESTTADADASSTAGRYNSAITALSVTVGTYSASASSATITVFNDIGFGSGDQYFINVPSMVGESVKGFPLRSGQNPVLQLRDPTESALASDTLPLVPPDPADFVSGGTFLALEFEGGEFSSVLIAATVDSIVLQVSDLLESLISDVMNLNITQGIANSIDSKINTALQALDDINQNNDAAAINALQAFINAVQAQRGNHISEADADVLIADAQAIIDLLNT